MQIKDLFTKNLFRPINGVVKADQKDEAVVWQELDEYVVTHELNKHFHKFIETYLAAMDNPKDPSVAGRIGVWISGFFGSGKSHFLKILSYLLENRPAHDPVASREKRPVSFFEDKIADAMLLADIKRTVAGNTEVILFNIDSKADNKEGRDAILAVFLRVFNEKQGYSGDAPHIAGMERFLKGKGLLERFHQAFKEVSGEEWIKERDAYLLMRDEVVKALSKTLDMSHESAAKWFDEADEKFKINIEGFAKLVKDYLDSRGPNHRIVFLVDEVGQFIGTDTHLMLNLQTITEDLGRICNGRAWVIVTSQEDIDEVLGEIRGSNDFSKIQGRFYTRLSLSSTNTDEVIQARLLEKTGDARRALEDLYLEKGDILKNQLSFSNNGATLKNFRDKDEFVKNYPFAPYHFQLVQKIFESIRKAGATGLHLSRGERSMLDAFQYAAKNISEKNLGTLVPLYEFYPAIESFLDTIVKKTIEQAEDNPGLEPFDRKLLCVLFLIRYVDIIRPNVDNLVTLCIDEVDVDRLSLRRKIEESLQRLEKETLISRNGDLYFFLTNEERDVGREIKNVDIASGEETKQLAELIFEDVLKGDNKYRYQINRRDYGYNRFCDGQPYGGRVNEELTVEVISPLFDSYTLFNPAKGILRSAEDNGRVVIRLVDNPELSKELRTLLQIDKYIRFKHDAAASEILKRILKDRAEENRERKNRLIQLLDRMILEADYYAIGQSLQIKTTTSRAAMADAINYLVKNIYTKLSYLKVLHDEPLKELHALLKTTDISQKSFNLDVEDANALALKEVIHYIDLNVVKNHRILLNEFVDRFARRPYGWPEWEIVILVAQLFIAGEIKLMLEGSAILPREAIEPLSKQVRWKQITILKRKAIGSQELNISRKIGQDLFGKIGPESEDGLYNFIRNYLSEWGQSLKSFKPLADTGNYPGKKEIDNGCTLVDRLLAILDSYEFFQAFNQARDVFVELAEDIHELTDFYNNQRSTWERLKKTMDGVFNSNRKELEKDPAAKQALVRINQILTNSRPYGMLKEVDGLLSTIKAVNDRLVESRQIYVVQEVDKKIARVSELLEEYKAAHDIQEQALKPLQDIKKQIQQEQSIPGIYYYEGMAKEQFNIALELLEGRKEKEESEKGIVKPVKCINPATLMAKNYLETESDVDEYLNTLRKELIAAIQNNARIRIE